MTWALSQVGDTYQAPDGVVYSLTHEPTVDLGPDQDNLDDVNPRAPSPIVKEVVQFEDLPLGSLGTRRAVVRWSDGTEREALRWYRDEILICDGDHGNSRLMALVS